MKKAEKCVFSWYMWPRSNACIQREEYKAIADVIWILDAVKAWVFEAADADERDCRACSLTTATTNALRNARQSWRTPQAHRNHYVKLADRLDEAPRYKPGGKRIEKLRRDLESEKVFRVDYTAVTAPTHASPNGRRPDKTHKLGKVGAAIVRIAEQAGLADAPTSADQADVGGVAPVYWPPLAEMASRARVFAEAAGDAEAKPDPNWTQPSSKHEHAARNTFIVEMVNFQRESYGAVSHAMIADIVCALAGANRFSKDDKNQHIDRQGVERLARQRKQKPNRGAKPAPTR